MGIKEQKDYLLSKHGVVAVGKGKEFRKGKPTDRDALVCSVEKKLPLKEVPAGQLIPKVMTDGTITDVIEVGRIKLLRTDHVRPAPCGVSVGHFAITAGTLGCCVTDTTGAVYILSNNHVLADVNSGQQGDAILQPGKADGGVIGKDTIARLDRFVPIVQTDATPDCKIAILAKALPNLIARLLGSRVRLVAAYASTPDNLVDCAVAKVEPKDVDNVVLGIGPITGAVSAKQGDKVQKSGRTTSITDGEILQTDVAANVDMGGGKVARFDDQLLMGEMSAGGDSGSAILDMDGRICGLLFAGSDKVTLANRIEHVFSALGVHLYKG